MADEQARYLLIVKVSKGIYIRDTPRPESQGARAIRGVGVGTALYAYQIHTIEGVQYARLVTRNMQPEWVRVAEANGGMEYVDVIEFGTPDSHDTLANAIKDLADAIRSKS